MWRDDLNAFTAIASTRNGSSDREVLADDARFIALVELAVRRDRIIDNEGLRPSFVADVGGATS